jgi:hypothetical protein
MKKISQLQMSNCIKVLIIILLCIVGYNLYLSLNKEAPDLVPEQRNQGELIATIKVREIKDDFIKLSIDLSPSNKESIEVDSVSIFVASELNPEDSKEFKIEYKDIKHIKIDNKISKDIPFTTGELNLKLPTVSKAFPFQKHSFNVGIRAIKADKELLIKEFDLQNNTSWFKMDKSLWAINQMGQTNHCPDGNVQCVTDFKVLTNFIYFEFTYSEIFRLFVITPYIVLLLLTIMTLWRRNFLDEPSGNEVSIIMSIIIGLPALHLTVKQNYNSGLSNMDILVLLNYLALFILYFKVKFRKSDTN